MGKIMSESYRRPLNKVLKTLKDEGCRENLFIGSGCGFFLIGTVEECIAKVDNISEYYRLQYRDGYNSIKEGIAKACKEAVYEDGQDLLKYADRLMTAANRIKSLVASAALAQKKYETFIPMGRRTVRDMYRKEVDNGIAIILPGMETGNYWTLDEWRTKNA